MRGDRLTYSQDTRSPAANLLEIKILLNSTISNIRKSTRFTYLDIKEYFLVTPMVDLVYM